MPRKALEGLTESMFYVLMAFCRGPMCGIDVAAFVEAKTGGRVLLGPATLYTILGKFEQERYIEQTQIEGRKRTYCITQKGHRAYCEELERLERRLADAREEQTGEEERHEREQCGTKARLSSAALSGI